MKKGVITFNLIITGLVVAIALTIVVPIFMSKMKDVGNDVGGNIAAREDVSGKQVIDNVAGVDGVQTGEDGTITFPDDFNSQTIMIDTLEFVNDGNCQFAQNNAYRCKVIVGESIFITPKWGPDNATKNSLKWVQESGKQNASTIQSFDTHSLEVFGKKAGRFRVIVSSVDGSFKQAAAYIQVIQLAEKVELDKTSGTLYVGDDNNTFEVNATVTPDDTTEKNVLWSFERGDTGMQECVKLESDGNKLIIRARSQCLLSGTSTVKITATTENGIRPTEVLTLTLTK